MTEAEFQGAVCDTLRLFGWRYCHQRPARTSRGWRTAISGDVGYPDLTCVRGDRILWLELKAETGRLTQEQANWLAALGTAGGSVHVVRPSDWPMLEELIR
jgi:VRR-NUC domain